MDPKICIFS